jgi:integrase
MAHDKLTVRGVEAKTRRGRYGDGGGLALQISKWGTKAWIFRYQWAGKRRQMGLGPAHSDGVSLSEAREKAGECRRLVREGRDPIEARGQERTRERLEAARSVSFRQCAESYIEGHEAAWRNPKHRAQWKSTLSAYAYPVIGALPVAAIDKALVLSCLEPIWRVKPETAKRVRGRIEAILDWAAARDHRSGDNPARWKGHLDKLLPAPAKVRAVRHHPAMPYAEIPGFMGQLRTRMELGARALELTVVTAVRTGEVIAARWDELDLVAKVWTIPAERMKAKREHRVPLSRRALEIFANLPRKGDYVLPGNGERQAWLSNMAMLELLKRMGRGDVTVHGFRSSFRDWAAERTGYQNHVVEMALAHAVGDKVEAAYRRGDLFDKRRRLMAEWATYCGCGKSPASGDENVLLMRSA